MNKISFLLGVIALVGAPAGSVAQGVYPSKPIRLIVSYPPGATTDIVARLVAPKLIESMGRQVIVDNRGGMSGALAAEMVARSTPDGYTVGIFTAPSVYVLPALLKRSFGYNPESDFTPVTAAVRNLVCVVAGAQSPVHSIEDLIKRARDKPSKLTWAHSGLGTQMHLMGEMFNQYLDGDMVQVAYKGGGPALIDIIGAQIPLGFVSVDPALPHIRSGKLRALALLDEKRFSGMTSVPAITEVLPGFDVKNANGWLGFLAPAGLPRSVTLKLNTEIVKALTSPDVRGKLEPSGLLVIGNTADEFAAGVKGNMRAWDKVVKALGTQSY